jgi:hypothetical protein
MREVAGGEMGSGTSEVENISTSYYSLLIILFTPK